MMTAVRFPLRSLVPWSTSQRPDRVRTPAHQLYAALEEHLDAEEQHILPLIAGARHDETLKRRGGDDTCGVHERPSLKTRAERA